MTWVGYGLGKERKDLEPGQQGPPLTRPTRRPKAYLDRYKNIAEPACLRGADHGHIQAGSTVDEMIHVVDIYPTLAGLAGASLGKNKPLDGMDVWPTINKGKPPPALPNEGFELNKEQ